MRSVSQALERVVDCLNTVSEHLDNQCGSGESDVVVYRFGAEVDAQSASDVTTCGSVQHEGCKRQRRRGYLLTEAIGLSIDAHQSDVIDVGSDHDYRCVLILGSVPPRDFDADLDLVLNSMQDTAFRHLVISCHPAIHTDLRVTNRFDVIPDDRITEDQLLEWALDGIHGKSPQNATASPAMASPALAPTLPITVSIPSLRAAIDQLSGSSTLSLGAAEYIGDCTISRDISIVGESVHRLAHIIGVTGPTIDIISGNVSLINVAVEAGSNGIAIRRTAGLKLSVSNVTIRGKVEGISGEDGVWDFPVSIDLSEVQCDTVFRFSIVLEVPVSCKLSTTVAGLTILTSSIDPGVWSVDLQIDPSRSGNIIFGYISLQSGVFRRVMQITARFTSSATPRVNSVVWKCARHMNGQAVGQSPAISSVPAQTAAVNPVQAKPQSLPVVPGASSSAPSGIGVQPQRKTTTSMPLSNPLFQKQEPDKSILGADGDKGASNSDGVKAPASVPADKTDPHTPKPTKSIPNPSLFGLKPK